MMAMENSNTMIKRKLIKISDNTEQWVSGNIVELQTKYVVWNGWEYIEYYKDEYRMIHDIQEPKYYMAIDGSKVGAFCADNDKMYYTITSVYDNSTKVIEITKEQYEQICEVTNRID
jgi:hypothetical protein